MKRAQKSRWAVLVLAILAGTSSADVTKTIRESIPIPDRDALINLPGMPPECRQFLAIPADSTSELLPWAQRLSVAACRQSIALAPVSSPERFRAMVAKLEQVMEPSLAIYRDAMARGPVQIKLLAAYGIGMTHLNIIVRARSAIRVIDDGASFGGAVYGGSPYVDPYQALHRALEPLLARQREAALTAFREVARLAFEHPLAARANPVMPVVIAIAAVQVRLLR